MRQMSLQAIEKKLGKRNAELAEVREFRKKLDAKEKEICADIEKLHNQKVEFIFTQVKREMKNEKLDISSGSILPLLEVLRKNQQITMQETDSTGSIEVEDSGIENETEISSLNSISKLAKD